MKATGVRIECGTGSDGKVGLRVSDVPSGELLAGLEMTALELLRLIAGTITTYPSLQTDHPERIGLRMENEQWRVPRDAASASESDWETACLEWAQAQPDAINWETFRASRHNFGLAVTVRRWVAS